MSDTRWRQRARHAACRTGAWTGGLAALGLAVQVASGTVFNDRLYLFGDNPDEGAVVGQRVGSGNEFFATFDETGTVAGGDLQDLVPEPIDGEAIYVDVGPGGFARPGAGSGSIGIRFNGVDQLMAADGFGNPNAHPTNNNPSLANNFSGIFERGTQMWAYPESDGAGRVQTLYTDSNDSAIFISADGRWGFQQGGARTITPEAVAFDTWTHVQYHSFGSRPGALLVNGVIKGIWNDWYGATASEMIVGANQGGNNEFFQGVLDDMSLYVAGSNAALFPDGANFGVYDGSDNQWIARQLELKAIEAGVASISPGDVNMDGVLDQDDIDEFISNWLKVQVIDRHDPNDVRLVNSGNGGATWVLGDWNSRVNNSDLDYDGITNLDDWFILRQAFIDAGQVMPAFVIPEPASLALMGIGLAALGRRRA